MGGGNLTTWYCQQKIVLEQGNYLSKNPILDNFSRPKFEFSVLVAESANQPDPCGTVL